MAQRRIPGWFVLSGVALGGIWLWQRWRKPAGAALKVVEVRFTSPAFSPGSSHIAAVRYQNVGTIALTVSSVRLLIGDFFDGTLPLIGELLAPGALGETQQAFTIPASYMVGTLVLYSVFVSYDTQVAERRNQTAFTIEPEPAPVLAITGVAFTSQRRE